VGIINFILNLAGLLLWLNWRTLPLDALSDATPGTLAGTLRRAERSKLKRWHFPVALVLLVVLRALLYWMVGPVVNWTGQLDLGVITVSFRSDYFWRMLLFSSSSFAVALLVFFLWMLLLSALDCGDPLRRLVRLQLGRVDGWPKWLRLSLPFGVGALAWWALSWLLARRGIVPPALSGAHRVAQAALVGLDSYLVWKYLIGGVLLLHLLDSYIYFGRHPFWTSLHALAKKMVRPLEILPMRVSKVDFAPLVGILLVFLFAHFVQNGMNLPPWARENRELELPLKIHTQPSGTEKPPPNIQEKPLKIPGLVDLYKRTT